jgi:two-component system, OmpR family, response regulator PhoP
MTIASAIQILIEEKTPLCRLKRMNQPSFRLPTIAVVEDDDDLRANILLFLRSKNFPAWGTSSAEQFYRERSVSPVDIVLIDLGLPGEDGLSALRHLRQSPKLGLIVITGRGDMESRISGLEAGVDHYFIKPINMRELHVTIEALWRKKCISNDVSQPELVAEKNRSAPSYSLNHLELTLNLPDGRKLSLSEREECLIRVLLDSHGAVVSRTDLHATVFSDANDIDPHRIDVLVSRLRQKAKTQFDVTLPIRTIFGKGFVFVA